MDRPWSALQSLARRRFRGTCGPVSAAGGPFPAHWKTYRMSEPYRPTHRQRRATVRAWQVSVTDPVPDWVAKAGGFFHDRFVARLSVFAGPGRGDVTLLRGEWLIGCGNNEYAALTDFTFSALYEPLMRDQPERDVDAAWLREWATANERNAVNWFCEEIADDLSADASRLRDIADRLEAPITDEMVEAGAKAMCAQLDCDYAEADLSGEYGDKSSDFRGRLRSLAYTALEAAEKVRRG